MNAIKRPAFVSDEHLAFLNGLRDAGCTHDMVHAARTLQAVYALPPGQAHLTLAYWLASYREREQKESTQVDSFSQHHAVEPHPSC